MLKPELFQLLLQNNTTESGVSGYGVTDTLVLKVDFKKSELATE